MGKGRFPTYSQSINFRSGGGRNGARILSGQTGHFENFIEICYRLGYKTNIYKTIWF